MVSILITANYLLLSEHNREESKITDIEIDSIYGAVIDVKNVLSTNQNNALADAMSDATFRALNCTFAGGALSSICNALLPTNILSEQCGTNLTKWILNYTNMTLLEIQKIITFADFKSSVNQISFKDSGSCGGSSNYRFFTYYGNISYNLTTQSSFYMRLNQTVLFNKTLSLANVYSSGPMKIYEINVTDSTKRVDFNKRVNCTSGACHPCAAGECFT
jgi:hypothetical protein